MVWRPGDRATLQATRRSFSNVALTQSGKRVAVIAPHIGLLRAVFIFAKGVNLTWFNLCFPDC